MPEDNIKYEELTADQQRVIQAIRGTEEHIHHLHHEFIKKTHELEREWAHKFQAAHDRRFALLSGQAAPTVSEVVDGEKRSHHLVPDYKNMPSLRGSSKPATIKGFWLKVLKSNLDTMTHIFDADEPALMNLVNITLGYPHDHNHPAFILEFHFSPNKYFTNEVLKLSFFFEDYVQPHGNLAYAFVKGDKIKWKPGQSLVKDLKPHHHHEEDEEPADGSFFSLFAPPDMITRHKSPNDDHDERHFELERHFETGLALKITVLSRATDYYIGDRTDWDSDDDDDNWSDFVPDEDVDDE